MVNPEEEGEVVFPVGLDANLAVAIFYLHRAARAVNLNQTTAIIDQVEGIDDVEIRLRHLGRGGETLARPPQGPLRRRGVSNACWRAVSAIINKWSLRIVVRISYRTEFLDGK